jgi:hypothetical protein
MSERTPTTRDAPVSTDPIELVREALVGLQYGQILITVHGGVVSQVERTEKLRPPKR